MSGKKIWTKLEGHKLLKRIFKEDAACKEKLGNMFTSNNTDTNTSLQGRYSRIIKGATENPPKWKVCKNWNDKLNFKAWYVKQYYEQNGKCHYCGLSSEEVRKYYGRPNGFREGNGNGNGTRGWTLEVDRKNPKGYYSVGNCVLTCYPCNNAKSDVFTYEEFIIIGAVIGALKRKDKLGKLKSNKFIQGLINEVTKAPGRKI